MIKEILPGIFQIKVPLPLSPLKVLNAYLVKGDARSLLIDTGFNVEESRKVLLGALQTLEIDPERLDIFLTHLHPDHSGLISAVASESTVIYCGELDSMYLHAIHTESYWSNLKNMFALHGFPQRDAEMMVKEHPGCNYQPNIGHVFSFVKDGYIIEAGGYRFHCLETPGHTPSHVCLYEPDHQLLICGDQILYDISSNISELGITDPLGSYLRSLEKIERLDVKIALPGHRRIIEDVPARIAELKEHHEQRLAEVIEILKSGPANGYQIAARMTWDYPGTWEQFPLAQRWFAGGEAVAHLLHLYNNDQIKLLHIDQKIAFSLK